MTIELRADSGFALSAVYAWCEAEGIDYTIGLGTNARLKQAVAALQAEAERQSATQDGAKVRLVGETPYQADSWPQPRRVVMKAEVLPKGTNTRLVVTTRTNDSTAVYAWYVARGESENWIKDLKAGCFADRVSCHRFWASQFRLLLHAAAGHRASMAGRPAGGTRDAGDAARAVAQDWWLGAGVAGSGSTAPRFEPSRRRVVAHPRDPPPPLMNNPG